MKPTKNQIETFVYHMADELGYEGERDIELLKQFITEKFFVEWLNEPEKFKQYKAKCGAKFTPNPEYSTYYCIYAKDWLYLIETVLFRIKSGDWKRENNG